jgi:hypothetical protein
MDDTDALIGTSSYASEVLSEIFDGWHLIKTSRKSELPAVLHRIEASAECLADALDDYGPAFALAAPPWPVTGDHNHTASSVHQMVQECGLMIRVVSLAIHRAADPQRYPRGVEHICPDLPSEDEILPHIDEAIEAYKTYLPSVHRLNWMGAAKEQELARAIEHVRQRNQPTTSPNEIPASDADDPAKEFAGMRIDKDDLLFLQVAVDEGYVNGVCGKSDAIYRKATGVTLCPRELRERLKKYGLIDPKQGKGITVLPKGERYVKLMPH